VARDYGAAKRWWRLAAARSAHASYNLGLLHESGAGVPRDRAMAARYYRQAAERGLAEAQFRLALMLYEGDGVARDSAHALMWFAIAAARGHPVADWLRADLLDDLAPILSARAHRAARAWLAGHVGEDESARAAA
jgi:TPR repeat protein